LKTIAIFRPLGNHLINGNSLPDAPKDTRNAQGTTRSENVCFRFQVLSSFPHYLFFPGFVAFKEKTWDKLGFFSNFDLVFFKLYSKKGPCLCDQIKHMKPNFNGPETNLPVKREKSKQFQFVYNGQRIFNLMQPIFPLPPYSSFSDLFFVCGSEFTLECICHLATAQLNACCCRRER